MIEGGIIGAAIGLYIIKSISQRESETHKTEHGGMADQDGYVDESDPENSFTDSEEKWYTIDDSRPVVEPGKNGSCPIGYKKIVGRGMGAKCLPIK